MFTKEQLEVVRDWLDDEPLSKPPYAKIRDLLAEVDRLTAELQKLKATPVRTGCDECLEERERLTADNERLREFHQKIAELDPSKDSEEGFNEWGEADCFNKAQALSREALEQKP